jgi:general secretion pathway protein K
MRRNENGIALVAVVWTVALLATVAASLLHETRSEARIARNMADAADARAAADAGVQRAILDLLETHAGQALKEAKFRPNGTIYQWRFGDCTVYIAVLDEFSKVNLNQAPGSVLTAIFELVNIDHGNAAALADAIADYRDADDLHRNQGSEIAEYEAAGLEWGPKNGPFEVVEELKRVVGMTTEVYARVEPFLTVYSLGNAINSEMASERLTEALREVGFSSFVNSPGQAHSVRAEARHDNGAVFVRGAVIQVIPGAASPVRVLAWRQER